MLHITNGESAGRMIRESGLTGEILAWDDVLHEGPTPAGLTLEPLSEVRARFVAGAGWTTPSRAREEFAQRDGRLARFGDHDEVVLWFEHDLYDQLQLIQLLDWFAGRDRIGTALSMIRVDRLPGVERLPYLGALSPSRAPVLFERRHAVTDAELQLGRRAWTAFRAPDPIGLMALIDEDTTPLPFLRGALVRHLEQFPSTHGGPSRTERQLLEAVATGAHHPPEIFRREQEREEAMFMGDTVIFQYLDRLGRCKQPLLARSEDGELIAYQVGDSRGFEGQALVVTEVGRAVLDGRLDHVALNGIDRWLGGVHLQGREAAWRWDRGRGRIVGGVV